MVNGTSSGKQIILQFAFNVLSLINVPISGLHDDDATTIKMLILYSLIQIDTHTYSQSRVKKWQDGKKRTRQRVTELRLQIDETTSSKRFSRMQGMCSDKMTS